LTASRRLPVGGKAPALDQRHLMSVIEQIGEGGIALTGR
jgi:hypothetical protein